MWLWLGCGGGASGEGSEDEVPVVGTDSDSASSDSDTGSDDPTDTEPPIDGSCPWSGTWSLQTIRCGAFDLSTWFEDHDGATMDIAHHPQVGCTVLTTITGPSCARDEAWTFTVPIGLATVASFDGIAACRPDGCSFGDAPPCEVGALATGVENVRIESGPGTLVASGLLGSTTDGCPLDLVTEWRRA